MSQRDPMPSRYSAIVRAVAAEHGVRLRDIFASNGPRRVQDARLAIYARIRATPLLCGHLPSYPQIGRWMGRDNSTVWSGVRAHHAKEEARP